ncbi:tRNA 2-thiouridine synthesizing protein A [Nocardioides albertanoniae]|uniref:tRNA 2-thiouridine synthesizing protein A n=1 Tax=Nocardioides albertanoniae TaxID=1175486 RepID=A0A543A9W7_9ACTN|nr:sulfurtransferase TusA family protein [Nocardioides albertanoniae]TQL69300.1 tRNA 2-thiouridine synthesizing protein A [Nocardioides albertanoniae]
MSEANVTLDCRGQACPRPIIELGRHLGDVEVGEEIAVAADDAAAHHDVPAWARMRGQEFVGESEAEDGVPVYRIRRLS